MMFAPLTYGLYILHFPVLVLINAQLWASNHLPFLVVCVPLLLLIAYLAELSARAQSTDGRNRGLSTSKRDTPVLPR